MDQLTINFEPGLRERYPTIYHVLRAMAERSQRSMKAIAADMDMSSSELSRRLNADLNENDTRVFDIGFLDAGDKGFMKATRSTLIIEWLAEGHMDQVNPARQQQRALTELSRLLPQLNALVAAAGVGKA
ncbi:MAG TPA: hypothetical protein VIL30_03530 [Ramlibacter sp.]|jgi:AraC-like DNA-binding protein